MIGIEEIDSWPMRTIGNVVISLNQGWSPRCEKNPCSTTTQWGVLKTTSVQMFSFLEMEHKKLPDNLPPRKNIQVEKNDVLMTCAGPRNRVGIACHVGKITHKLMYSGKKYRIKVDHSLIRPKYLVIVLNSPQYQDLIDEMKTGGSDSGLNLTQKRFKQLMIPVPSLSIQLKIEEYVEDSFSFTSQLEQKVVMIRNQLSILQSSIIVAACQGKLVLTEAELARKDGRYYEPADQLLERILSERRARFEADNPRKKYIEPIHPNTTDLPNLPEGWCWASIEQLSYLASGQTPKGVTSISSNSGNIPWFRVGDMNLEGNEILMKSASVWLTKKQVEDLRLHVRPSGTIIFPKRGGAIMTDKKRILAIPSCYDLNIMGLIPVGSIKDYLWMFFSNIKLETLAGGSSVPQINNPDIAPILIPLPPADEQLRINNKFSIMKRTLNKIISLNDDNEERVTTLKHSMLYHVFPVGNSNNKWN